MTSRLVLGSVLGSAQQFEGHSYVQAITWRSGRTCGEAPACAGECHLGGLKQQMLDHDCSSAIDAFAAGPVAEELAMMEAIAEKFC